MVTWSRLSCPLSVHCFSSIKWLLSYIVRGDSSCKYFILSDCVWDLLYSLCSDKQVSFPGSVTMQTIAYLSLDTSGCLYKQNTRRQISEVNLMWSCRITATQWNIHSYFALRLIAGQLWNTLLKSDKKTKTLLRPFVLDTTRFNSIMKPISYLYIPAYFIS
jgi:hypothetical protein